MLEYFRTRAIGGVESVDGDAYRRTIEIDGRAGVLELRPVADGALRLTAHLPDGRGLTDVAARARRIFALDHDPADVNARLGDDPLLAAAVARHPGMRVPGTWDPYETGVRAIVGQQVSVRGASTVTARIVQRAGRPVAGFEHLGLTHTFPAPATLAQADLGTIGMPAARVAAIHAFARAVDEGHVQLDGGLPLDELMAAITAVPGLGPWTASYLALRMGEADAFPASDLGLRRAAGRGGGPLSAAVLLDRAEVWRPFRAAAAVRLWMSDT